MKVTEKKFLNVHQTLSPLTTAGGAGATSTNGAKIAAKAAADKVLVRSRNLYDKKGLGKVSLILLRVELSSRRVPAHLSLYFCC